ncbi:hypothetical protein PUN28_005723 [Cardiocondyla obscurior]|uniref:Uncharacterized protein n=1 Tax=Cardiocondyla obscurior TaxID=286306 RepID=A0AAW2G6Z5_9HYME
MVSARARVYAPSPSPIRPLVKASMRARDTCTTCPRNKPSIAVRDNTFINWKINVVNDSSTENRFNHTSNGIITFNKTYELCERLKILTSFDTFSFFFFFLCAVENLCMAMNLVVSFSLFFALCFFPSLSLLTLSGNLRKCLDGSLFFCGPAITPCAVSYRSCSLKTELSAATRLPFRNISSVAEKKNKTFN